MTETNDISDAMSTPTNSNTTTIIKNGSNNKGEIHISPSSSDLLQWKDMPHHLQFNPYVITGYRPLMKVKGCLHSLFYMHNETINILSHGKIVNNLIILY